MIAHLNTALPAARALMLGASALAMSAPLAANELIFTTSDAQPETGLRVDQRGGLTQVALTGGGMVSIVDAAEYRLNADGSIDLYEGSITVASAEGREVVVRMPEGLEGRVAGAGAAGNFSARKGGEASGHALTGAVRIGRGGAFERFAAGELWRVRGQGAARRVVANAAQVQPDAAPAVVAIGGDAGPVAAALNGIPVGFGDQLAGAGASADIVLAARRIEAAVGNPALDTFPSGDLALLVAAAARLETSFGGRPFPEAQADIIRAYLRFLAGGGAGSGFVAAYSRFVADYLDLIRIGGLPSGFAAASPADVEAYLAYIRRTGALTSLAARDSVLAEAYLAFLASSTGGSANRDSFAASFTNLTAAYFNFVRGGGDPAAFTGASEAALAQTIAFLRDSGLVVQLGAADRALVEAYLANGGLAFAAQYRAVLSDYFAFLASGRRPSEYAAIDQATLRAYLETLETTGLLQSVLGERAGFFADYLAFLRGGGGVDAFAGLPANIFAGYTAQLDAYFAFLASGRLPSEFRGTDLATLQAFIAQMQAAGALERFLGTRAGFFAEYAAFVAAGGSFDSFAGLPANIFAGYARDLAAFFEFLELGGVPSAYTLLTPETIRAYLAALEEAGATGSFLGQLTGFFRSYGEFLASGGNPDLFAGLPVPPDFPDFAAALNAYAAFLQGGGLPSGYSAEDLARLQVFLDAVVRSGQLAALLGANGDLLTRYFAHLAGGGSPDGFAGLPLYLQYVSALNAYFAFLQAGGLPSAYTALDADTIEAYLAALARVQGGLGAIAGLERFFVNYFAFVAGGGNPDQFAGLPVNGGGSTPGAPAMLAGYTGGFDAANPRINFILGGQSNSGPFVGSESGFAASAYTLDANGGLASYTRDPGGGVRNRGAAQQTDIFGNANAVIGRWTNGTITIPNTFTFSENQGLHYLLTRPVGPNFIPSLTGRVDYYLVGATRPTIANGSFAPGTFEAGLAIALGGEYRLAMEGTITMPRTGSPYVFTFGTQGGLADPARSESIIGFNTIGAFFASIPGNDNAGSCTSPDLCEFNLRGTFAGGENTVGITYDARTATAATAIVGAAIFEAGPQRTFGGTSTPPPAPPPAAGTGNPVSTMVFTDHIVTQSNRAPARNLATTIGLGNVGYDTDAAGQIVALRQANTNLVERIGTAQQADTGRAASGLVRWTRWTNGTIEVLGTATEQLGFTADQGYHVIVGTPAVDLPVTGRINYNLIGGTSPTSRGGIAVPGTLTRGAAAVEFGSQIKVGVELAFQFAGQTFDARTTGGLTNVGLSEISLTPGLSVFTGSGPSGGVTSSGNYCAASCRVTWTGFLAGTGGTEMGLSYLITPTNQVDQRIMGAAAFASSPASASLAANPVTAAAPAADWSRWTGGPAPAGTVPAASDPSATSGWSAPAVSGFDGIGGETDRAAAIRKAEALMGGMIAFPAASLPDR